MNYPGLSQTQSPEYVGMGNEMEPQPYRPQPQRADRLGANIVDNFGGSYSNAAAPNIG